MIEGVSHMQFWSLRVYHLIKNVPGTFTNPPKCRQVPILDARSWGKEVPLRPESLDGRPYSD